MTTMTNTVNNNDEIRVTSHRLCVIGQRLCGGGYGLVLLVDTLYMRYIWVQSCVAKQLGPSTEHFTHSHKLIARLVVNISININI